MQTSAARKVSPGIAHEKGPHLSSEAVHADAGRPFAGRSHRRCFIRWQITRFSLNGKSRISRRCNNICGDAKW